MSKEFEIPKRREDLEVIFFVWNHVVYALNHGQLNNLIVPARQAIQYPRYFAIIEAAIADLKNKSNGRWVYTGATGWRRFDLSIAEMQEIARFDESILVENAH